MRRHQFTQTAEAVQTWATTAKMLGEDAPALQEEVSIPLPVLRALVETSRDFLGVLMQAGSDEPPSPAQARERQRMFAAVVTGEKYLFSKGIVPTPDEVWVCTPPSSVER
jgi:hypothetical protein